MPTDLPSDWSPTATLEILQLRARVLADIRAFFAARGVLEVETPALSVAATTDPAIHSLVTKCDGPGCADGRRMYLHTSPEFPMKRLLASGSGPIYQICRVFRDREAGRWHNPEFTMLEWYRPGLSHHELMTEVEALTDRLLPEVLTHEPPQRMSYAEAFSRYTGIEDVHAVESGALRSCAREHGIEDVDGLEKGDLDGWRDLLMSHVIVPALTQVPRVFIFDYPVSQASLARVVPGTPPVAQRFELLVNGVELANGFRELADPAEQHRRFVAEQERRRASGEAEVPWDRRLIAALAAGLPDCAGVALGVDRLVMLVAGAGDISEVIAFPAGRA